MEKSGERGSNSRVLTKIVGIFVPYIREHLDSIETPGALPMFSSFENMFKNAKSVSLRMYD